MKGLYIGSLENLTSSRAAELAQALRSSRPISIYTKIETPQACKNIGPILKYLERQYLAERGVAEDLLVLIKLLIIEERLTDNLDRGNSVANLALAREAHCIITEAGEGMMDEKRHQMLKENRELFSNTIKMIRSFTEERVVLSIKDQPLHNFSLKLSEEGSKKLPPDETSVVTKFLTEGEKDLFTSIKVSRGNSSQYTGRI